MKKLMFLPLFALVIFSMAIVSSANDVTLTLPAQDASISGSYVLSADLDTNTLNMTSATFFYETGGVNTTIGTTPNETATQFNYTWVTTDLIDVNDYTIWVNVSNATAMVTSDPSTGVDIDNGNPTATWSSASFIDNLALISSTTITLGLDADSSIGISSCKVYFTNSKTNVASTKDISASGNACTNTTTPASESLGVNEVYTVVIEATDGNDDKVNSSSRTLRVTPVSAGGGGSTTLVIDDGVPSDKISNFFTRIIDSIKNFFGNFFK